MSQILFHFLRFFWRACVICRLRVDSVPTSFSNTSWISLANLPFIASFNAACELMVLGLARAWATVASGVAKSQLFYPAGAMEAQRAIT